MKRGTLRHKKLYRLAGILKIPRLYAAGVLEALWEWVSEAAPTGSLGDASPSEICAAIGYEGDPDELLRALIASNWLEVSAKCANSVCVHDWADHCEDSVHSKLARARLFFANGQVPRLTRLSGKDRSDAEEWFRTHGARSARARRAPKKRPALALALALEPAPAPAPATETPLPPKGGLPPEASEENSKPKPGAKPKKKKPEEAPAPYRQFTDEFCRLWKKEHGGAKYPFQRKDGPAAAAIWDYVEQDLGAAMEIVQRYFENTTPFFAGHPLTKLASNLSQFAAGESVPDFMKARMPTPAEIAMMAGEPPLTPGEPKK